MTDTAAQMEGTDLRDLLGRWRKTLHQSNRAAGTIAAYCEAADRFARWLEAAGMPTDVTRISREHVEAYEAAMFDLGRKPNSVAAQHRYLRLYFKFALAEYEIAASPMANMGAPFVPEILVDVPPDDDVRRLLRACEGRGFEQLRDLAIIRLLAETGLRASECMNLKVDDVNFDRDRVRVLGKGRRERDVPIGDKTYLAVDRYRTARKRHRHVELEWWWLSQQGHFTAAGLRPDARAALRAGRHHPHPPPPVAPPVRPHLEDAGRQRGRPHGGGRLEGPGGHGPLRGDHGGGAGGRGASPPGPRGPLLRDPRPHCTGRTTSV